ncbi:MAG: methyltransferase family protein [Planctomycetota bacterium]
MAGALWDFLTEHFGGLPQPWWAVLAIYETLLVGAWLVERALVRRFRRLSGDPTGSARKDRRYVRWWVLQLVLLQLPLLRAGRWRTPLPLAWPTVWTGVALALSGVAIRLWSLSVLRENFSYVVHVDKGHRLVTAGPYRLVRHPLYSGLIVFFLGVPLVICDLWILLVLAGYIGVSVTLRIRREERALRERFGAAYEAWRAKTRLLVPFIF